MLSGASGRKGQPRPPAALALTPGGSTGTSGLGVGEDTGPNLSSPLPPQVLLLLPGADCPWRDLLPFAQSGFGFPGVETGAPLCLTRDLPPPAPTSARTESCYHSHDQRGRRNWPPELLQTPRAPALLPSHSAALGRRWGSAASPAPAPFGPGQQVSYSAQHPLTPAHYVTASTPARGTTLAPSQSTASSRFLSWVAPGR